MTEEVNFILSSIEEDMRKSIVHLEEELLKIRAGKSNPSMLSSVMVDYYGSMTALTQVANISTPDPRTLTVQPWEKQMLEPISTAILNANLGFTPQNNGEIVIISIPMLTEERRKELVKRAKVVVENAKVSIRTVRKDGNDEIKKLQKDGLPEDVAKGAENQIQEHTNDFTAQVDKLFAVKEIDIMKV